MVIQKQRSDFTGNLNRNPIMSFIIEEAKETILGFSQGTISVLESAKLRALRALVPYVPRALRAPMPYVPRALRALVPHVPRALRALVPHVPRASRALVPYVPRALRALVPYMLSCLTCLRCSCTSHVLCLACSRAGSNSTCSFAPRPSLASGVSSECISCLLAFMPLVSCAFVALAI